MANYLDDTAERYGVFVSDLRCSPLLREQVLLELTVTSDKYSVESLTEAVSYLEGKKVFFKNREEMRRQIFRYLKIGKDNFVIGSSDCGDLVLDEKNHVYLLLGEPGSHPIGTTVERMEDAVYLGEDGHGL